MDIHSGYDLVMMSRTSRMAGIIDSLTIQMAGVERNERFSEPSSIRALDSGLVKARCSLRRSGKEHRAIAVRLA